MADTSVHSFKTPHIPRQRRIPFNSWVVIAIVAAALNLVFLWIHNSLTISNEGGFWVQVSSFLPSDIINKIIIIPSWLMTMIKQSSISTAIIFGFMVALALNQLKARQLSKRIQVLEQHVFFGLGTPAVQTSALDRSQARMDEESLKPQVMQISSPTITPHPSGFDPGGETDGAKAPPTHPSARA
jgi:hypothetical protein